MRPAVVIETLIIGAGQAGLSMARYLKEYNHPFIILEKESEVGTSWIRRYDSLILDSFARYSHLEGFKFPGDQKRQPTKNEVAQYLKSFSAHFGLTPVFGTEVFSIKKEGSVFTVTTNNGIYHASNVVIATGPFHTPYIPPYARNISKDIYQIHTTEYRNESSLPKGNVLIVGGGNSGSEIAKELATKNRTISFAYKGSLKSIPSSQFSQWVAYTLGVAHIPQHSLLGKLVRWYTKGKSVGMDTGMLLRHPKVSSPGEIITVTPEGEILSKKGSVKNISVVIWATGYTDDFSLIDIKGFDPSSYKRGITNIDGLYVLHIRWQYSKSSSHLAGISRDAKYIALQIQRKNTEG